MLLKAIENKLKEKKGSGTLAAVLVAIFSILIIVVIGMIGVKLMNEYTTLDSFGDQYIRVMAKEGCTNNDRVIRRYAELVEATGIEPDVTVEAKYIKGSNTKVQYGDSITIHLKVDAKFSAVGVSLPITLKIDKTAQSEQYWK